MITLSSTTLDNTSQGGRSGRDALESMQTSGIDGALREWLRQVTRIQNGPSVLLVQIMHGGNDMADYRPSLGPIGGLNSSLGPGHEDNMRGIIAFLRAAWIQSGHDSANLFFQFGPYHPRPERELQENYEQAWRNIAASDPQVFAVAGYQMSTPDELQQRGFLLGGNDPYHLAGLGFHAWAAATVRAIDLAICPTDFNQTGVSSLPDIFAFLTAWFGNERRADFDYSGLVGVPDIFAFLTAWFAGCP